MEIRAYREQGVADMVRIWNQVVEEGVAFPQEDYLDENSGKEFFAAQSYCGVAKEDGVIMGLYTFIRITAAAADIYPTQALRWMRLSVESTSEKSWLRIVWSRQRSLASAFCSSMRL